MKRIFFIIMTALLAIAVSAQTYSGTLTFTPAAFPLDISLINAEINDQTLVVTNFEENEYYFNFASVPILKEGEPNAIGFNGTIEDGVITVAPFAGNFSGLPITMTVTSSSVSGNNIALTILIKDNATNGTLVNVTSNYTGTKVADPTGINDVLETKTITGYYSLTGKKLAKAPESGIYIIKYDNGKTEKVVK